MAFEFMHSKMYLFLKLEKQEIDKLKWIEITPKEATPVEEA